MTEGADKSLSKDKVQHKELRHEIWEERYISKARVDYYGHRAARLKLLIVGVNTVTLLMSSAVVVTVLKSWAPWLLILFSLLGAFAAIFAATNNWSQEQAVFLAAQTLARNQETRWDELWLKLNLRRYKSVNDVFDEHCELKRIDALVQQLVQPHVQDSSRVQDIQEKIKDYLEATQIQREGGKVNK